MTTTRLWPGLTLAGVQVPYLLDPLGAHRGTAPWLTATQTTSAARAPLNWPVVEGAVFVELEATGTSFAAAPAAYDDVQFVHTGGPIRQFAPVVLYFKHYALGVVYRTADATHDGTVRLTNATTAAFVEVACPAAASAAAVSSTNPYGWVFAVATSGLDIDEGERGAITAQVAAGGTLFLCGASVLLDGT